MYVFFALGKFSSVAHLAEQIRIILHTTTELQCKPPFISHITNNEHVRRSSKIDRLRAVGLRICAIISSIGSTSTDVIVRGFNHSSNRCAFASAEARSGHMQLSTTFVPEVYGTTVGYTNIAHVVVECGACGRSVRLE
jgi:hypothetical protein